MTVTTKPDGLGTKAMSLFGSLRFWTLTLATTALAIAHPERLWEIISGYFGAVTAVGSADSVAEKLSSKKPTL